MYYIASKSYGTFEGHGNVYIYSKRTGYLL